MATPSNELMELILRECDAAAGQPWYLSEYAQATGVNRDQLDEAADHLRLAGLIRLTEWVQGKGQGYRLTEAGHEVVSSPRQLDRLRRYGVPKDAPKKEPQREFRAERPESWDRGKMIQEAMTAPQRPIVTLVLIGICLANFVFGMMLVAGQGGNVNDYFGMGGNRVIGQVRHATGALDTRFDVQQGHWWKLLTSAFVHHGLIHLGMNMLALYILGSFVERMWGSLRYLLLFLISGIIGSMIAVLLATHHTLLAGASGAICGMLGSILPWVVLNKPYLPREFTTQITRNTIFNIILISFISTFPGVSWQGHLGGGIAGLILAVPLNFSRFGLGSQRIAGWLGVMFLPVVFFAYVGYQFAPTELERARARYTNAIIEADQAAVRFMKNYGHDFANQLEEDGKVDSAQVKKTFKALAEIDNTMKETLELLRAAPTYGDDRVNQAVDAAKKYLESWEKYLQTMRQAVSDEGEAIPAEVRALRSVYRRNRELFRQVQDSVLFGTEKK